MIMFEKNPKTLVNKCHVSSPPDNLIKVYPLFGCQPRHLEEWPLIESGFFKEELVRVILFPTPFLRLVSRRKDIINGATLL